MADLSSPRLIPLGDSAMIVRFSGAVGEAVTSAVVAFARVMEAAHVPGIVEIVPNLVSVLVRYDPLRIGFAELCAELRMLLSSPARPDERVITHTIAVRFGGEDGPDLGAVSKALGMSEAAFIARHNQSPLRVLATGFAPGFVYCGVHGKDMRLPRRKAVRDRVPPGSVLFAAGQTAIASTPVPTGWHVIGHTDFTNFDPLATPPTRLRAGDEIAFEAVR